jgi:hypothetical protein
MNLAKVGKFKHGILNCSTFLFWAILYGLAVHSCQFGDDLWVNFAWKHMNLSLIHKPETNIRWKTLFDMLKCMFYRAVYCKPCMFVLCSKMKGGGQCFRLMLLAILFVARIIFQPSFFFCSNSNAMISMFPQTGSDGSVLNQEIAECRPK